MGSLDRTELGLAQGVLLEAAGDGERIAVWVRLEREGKFEYWDRVVARVRDQRDATDGVRWAPATAVRTRRRSADGRLGRLFAKIAGRPSDASWIMPDGAASERCGDKRGDLALAWLDEPSRPLDEGRLTEIWRGHVRLLRLGSRLVLAAGVEAGAAADRDEVAEAEEPAETAARRLLASARAAGDRRAEATSLADLAMSWAKDGRAEAAVGPLNEALALYRMLDDRGGEADVLVDLGRVLEDLGRPHESQRALDAAAALAGGLDAFTGKAVLERLADTLARRGYPAGAASVLGRAAESARAAGDRRHEARLLWLEAAAWAEAGRPDLSLIKASKSTELLRSVGAAETDWYEAQLRRYRSDALASVLSFRPSDAVVASSPVSGGDPGVLRMALSATRAMATFLGSSMRTTTVEQRVDRLAACRDCVHHTGLRCRICGCFTTAKAAMSHERCPIGRWNQSIN